MLGLLATAIVLGCGQPQVEPGHRDLVLHLATATSTRDEASLSRAGEAIRHLEAAGELPDVERKAFGAIIDTARRGDWDRARQLAYSLRDAQKPTAEDRERVANRTMPQIKRLGTDASGR